LKEQDDFNEKVSKSIDRAIDSLGESVGKVLYRQLERDFGVGKDNVPTNPDALLQVLEKIFGTNGRDFLVKLVKDELIKEFDLPKTSKERERELAEILKEARRKYLSDKS
jgi:ribosomal protein L19E